VDPVPDPLLFFGSAGNRTRASGSVAKTTEAVAKTSYINQNETHELLVPLTDLL
jgi:hypothetical protein